MALRLRRLLMPLRRIEPLWRLVVRSYLALRALRAAALTPWVRLRPRRASDAEVAAALGGATPLEALSGPVLAALPTVARLERRLAALEAAERERLVASADRVLAHRFDLLGSGPRDLGGRLPWDTDFKSGRRWPAKHISGTTISYPDGSDIRIPWELSRGQHLPVLAAAHRLTGDARYLDEIGAQLRDWIARNPVELGPNWACTMDVAIRAANWVAALALCREAAAGQPWLASVLRSLLLHGRFIRGHLEWSDVRGNHYLSDVVGLLVVAALFRGEEGRLWSDWAAAELVRELDHQVNPDGTDHEASIPYHRLVTELFACGLQAADALAPGVIEQRHRSRLDDMLSFTAHYTRPDGLAPQVGDADDGRFLPLDGYGTTDHRWHGHLFEQADRSVPAVAGSAAYPDGGYYVVRRGELYLLVRCGSTGMAGRGGHSHNDQLSFELCWAGQPMVIDPGTYVYTAEPAARNLFRSTGYHSTLRVDGGEQNELRGDLLFLLPDRTRAECVAWDAAGEPAVFEGLHHGYEGLRPGALHSRRITAHTAGRVVVEDVVESAGEHELEWTFPLAPCRIEPIAGGVEAIFPAGRLRLTSADVALTACDGWYSPSYGVRVPTPFVQARRRSRAGADRTIIELEATS